MVATRTEPATEAPTAAASGRNRTGRRQGVIRFIRHYLEMVLAMGVGMIVLNPPVTALATAVGADGAAADSPITAAATMTASMAAGMASWMWYRGHRPRHMALMVAVMFPPGMLAGVFVAAEVLTAPTAGLWSHLAMLALMLAVMLADPISYTRPAPHRRRLGALLRGTAALIVAVLVVIGIAAAGLTHRVAAAYEPPSPTGPGSEMAARPKPHDPRQPTAVVVLGGAGAEVGDVLGPYETLATTGRLNVYTVAADNRPVPLTGGLDLVPDLTFTELEHRLGATVAPAVVVVPAMPDAGRPGNALGADWVRRQHRQGALVLAVCNGARILAGASLLDGRPATSHWIRLPGLRDTFPQVHWRSGVRYVDDGDIITTGGILSGIDGSLRVVERLLGAERAASAATTIQWRHYRADAPAALPPSTLAPPDLIGALNAGYRWHRPTLGVLLTEGVGELELVSVFDPYAGQSFAVNTLAVSVGGPVRTRHGLTLVPRSDLVTAADRIDRLVVPGRATQHRVGLDAATRAAGLTPHYLHTGTEFPLDAGLRDLAATVDVPTALWAAKMLEYPIDGASLPGPGWPWTLTIPPLFVLIATLMLLRLSPRIVRRLWHRN